MKKLTESIFRLFNAVIEVVDCTHIYFEDTIKYGFYIDKKYISSQLFKIVKDIYLSSEQVNNSFYKNWETIRNLSDQKRFVDQILHYMSTYGMESVGMYNKKTVYIPHQELDIPEITEDIILIPINIINKNQLLTLLKNIIYQDIAFSKQSIEDIKCIFENYNTFMKQISYDSIKNRELKSSLNELFGIVPSDPEEWIRFLMFKLTDSSLLIKNRETRKLIYMASKNPVKMVFFEKMLNEAPKNLASIFYRYKMIFLALKKISKNKTFFNKLRRQAPKMHVPIKSDYFSTIISQIQSDKFNISEFKTKLEFSKISIFRKIRLSESLMYRINPTDTISYRVRNGKQFTKKFYWNHNTTDTLLNALYILQVNITNSCRKNIYGKTFYIPHGLNLTVPSSEKKFCGNFPHGSSFELYNNQYLIIGIHWTNNQNRRVDLDLSMISQFGKIGWNSHSRNEKATLMYSGDMTDAPAPNGATELLYAEQGIDQIQQIIVNDYNYIDNSPVKMKFFIALKQLTVLEKNYVVDPNNIIFETEIEIVNKQTVLGLLIPELKHSTKLYMTPVSFGDDNVVCENEYTKMDRKFQEKKLTNQWDLKDLIINAGGNIIEDKSNQTDYIDLSPKSLTKDSIINLIGS